MNVVVMYGRMVRDPEVRESESGKKVARFNIAVSRDKETSDFFNCVAFDKTAEVVGKYLNKGNRVALRGRLRCESYEDKNTKEKKYYTDIIVDTLDLVETKKDKENGSIVDDLPFE